MVLAAALVTSNSALVKVGTNELGLSALDIVFWRSFTSVPLALYLARGRLWIQAWWWLLPRIGFGFGAMWASFTATNGLGVGELSVLSRLQPIFVGLVAPLLLGGRERSGGLVWIAMGLGLLGSTLMLGHDVAALDWSRLSYAALAVAAAASSAVAHTALRALGATDDPRTIVLWLQGSVGVLAALLLLLTSGTISLPTGPQFAVVCGVGALSMAGQLTMTHAYRLDHAPRVAAAAYSGPLFGFALDAAVFLTIPSWTDGLGAVVVVAAGALLAASRELQHREAHREAE